MRRSGRWLIAGLVGTTTVALLAACGGGTAATSARSTRESSSASTSSAPATTPTASPAVSIPTSASPATVAVTVAAPPPAATPSVRGFGATMADWQATHTLDSTVVTKDAYLPHVVGGDDPRLDTWQLVSLNDGNRVSSYTLNVTPTSFAVAVTRARQELPADATMLWSAPLTGNVGNSCYEAEWQSPTLAAVLGSGYVNVLFDDAATGDRTPITELMFDDTVAPTKAQATEC